MGKESPVLTAQAVESARFDHARFPSRGYNEDQVDEFLDHVVHTIRVLNRTVEEQRREIDRLKHWRQNTGTMVDNYEQEARARAEEIIGAARASAEEIRRMAAAGVQPGVRSDHMAAVVEVLDRLHMLRDGLSAELNRLETALTSGR